MDLHKSTLDLRVAEVEMSVDYCIIQDGEEGIEINDNGDLEWGSGNLDEDPYFAALQRQIIM